MVRCSLALVSMPFASTLRPSIQLGLLKSIVEVHGIPTATLHINLEFAARFGLAPYEVVSDGRTPQFGDWIFSREAFGDAAPDPRDLLPSLYADAAAAVAPEGAELLLRARRRGAGEFLDHVMSAFPWRSFGAIGFTSTFQQNVASFALAGRLRAAFPEIPILFGGANFDGDMGREYLRALDCIDYVIMGEADHALPALLWALLTGSDPALIPGVALRDADGNVTALPAMPLASMHAQPTPDYGEYFERRAALELGTPPGAKLRLPFEGSRGCWWGEKHHCTFCGLNGTTMRFRARPTEAILGELATLARRHAIFAFEAVDNIMDMRLLRDMFERLEKEGLDYDLFYEVKSNLTRAQIRRLARGGVRRLQPGIEALSTPLLRLMRKGVTALQNVNTLRWTTYYRIHTAWNLLWGFPGEQAEDFDAQLAVLQVIAHLPPPVSAGRVWIERFSPLYAEQECRLGAALRPEASYALIYPPSFDIGRIAYFFEHALPDTLPKAAFAATAATVARWQSTWMRPVSRRPRMVFHHAPGLVQIDDLRDEAAPRVVTLHDPHARLYAACSDEPRSAAQLAAMWGAPDSAGSLAAALDALVRDGLTLRDGPEYLSLALPATLDR